MYWGDDAMVWDLGGIERMDEVFTQEQVQQMIADATKGLLTETDLEKKVQAEVDRRVETGIQKGLDTHKQKWEQEFGQRANQTADELAKTQFEEYMKKLSEKETMINKRQNEIDAIGKLTEANVPKTHYEKFLGLLINDNVETTTQNVTNFIDMFNTTKLSIETEVKSQLGQVPPPKVGPTSGVTKADFNKMDYAEKMKFRLEHPQKFTEFMK